MSTKTVSGLLCLFLAIVALATEKFNAADYGSHQLACTVALCAFFIIRAMPDDDGGKSA